ncbi:MAG: DUF4113 domain-containing protein, partial [Desulfuromonadales bacterium]|nr:DUF4113 domain-containing protein [Desulfuromonadales bacterium]
QRATVVTVFIRTSPFRPGDAYDSNAATGTLVQASSDTREILQLAMQLFDRIWKAGYRYAKGGVMLGGFCREDQVQYRLFHPQRQSEQDDRLMRTLDTINQGSGSVWFGGQQARKDWFMTRENLSPAYTTRWDSLPRIG